MLGNPPWERIKLQEKEWFSAREPAIANAPNAAARKRKIQALEADNPALYAAFLHDRRRAEGESTLARNTGRFPLCGRGDVNTYTVFAETFKDCISNTGRSGIIVPSGIATDDTTKFFFQKLIASKSLVSLFDFENRKKIFDAVDSRMKFCLLTMGGVGSMPKEGAMFTFFALGTDDLKDANRVFTLSAEEIELINPNTRTCPIFRTRRDAELTKSIYRRVPVLIKEARNEQPEENPWGIKFSTMFHMSNDSHLFRTREQLEEMGYELTGNIFNAPDSTTFLPLYEAKMTQIYDHRAAGIVISETAVARQGQPEDLTPVQKKDPSLLPLPRYWVDKVEINERFQGDLMAFLGFTNVTSPTNARSLLATLLPIYGVGHSMPLIIPSVDSACIMLLYACLDSFIFDYIGRQKLGGVNYTYFILKQVSAIPPTGFSIYEQFIKRSVLELSYTAHDLDLFSNDCGYVGHPFIWNEDRRFEIRCELDAAFFHLYGIDNEDDVDYIMETFPIVKRKDEKKHGTYRTKERILEIYRDMARCTAEGSEYKTALNPPPGPPTDAEGNFIPVSEWDPNNWPSHIHRPKEEGEG